MSTSTLPKRHMEALLLSELPKEYQNPDAELLRATARERRCRLKDVQWRVVLISMDCNLASDYDKGFNSLDKDFKAWAVPHLILSKEEYAERTGHARDLCGQAAAAKKYIDGFGKFPRPPNYAAIVDVSAPVSRPNE